MPSLLVYSRNIFQAHSRLRVSLPRLRLHSRHSLTKFPDGIRPRPREPKKGLNKAAFVRKLPKADSRQRNSVSVVSEFQPELVTLNHRVSGSSPGAPTTQSLG